MPGQCRRRERQRSENEWRRRREEAGRWEVLFETTDADEMRAYMGRPRAGDASVPDEDLRQSILCGRLEHPTWYRVSRLVLPG